MSENNSVVLHTTAAIDAYGHRDDVREITDRLMHLHPAAKDVGVSAMRAVAQLALMRGANPLPTAGEIYVWTDGRGKVLMDMGIAYYRRIASKKDRVLWEIEPRLMTAEERERFCIAEGDIGAVCKGALLSQAKELMDLGISFKEAREASARTSTAIVEYGDQFYTNDSKYSKKGDPRSAPHGRTWQWVAEKRAEKAFYKMMSLVDDTLTERIDAVNEVREQVGKAFQLHEDRQGYTLAQANSDFYDIRPSGPEWGDGEGSDIVIIDVEVEDDVELMRQVEDARNGGDPTLYGEKEPEAAAPAPSVDWRAKLARTRRQTVATVASVLVAAGIRDNEPHATASILSRWPDLEGAGHQLSPAEAVMIWDHYQDESGDEEE